MKLINLFELRKNAHMYERQKIANLIKEFQSKCGKIPNTSMSNGFISFTTLRKIGINPKSAFNTPNGIYSYDVDYVVDLLAGDINPVDSSIPYAGDAPYFHTFTAKRPERLYMVGHDEEKLKNYVKHNHPEMFEKVYDDEAVQNALNSEEFQNRPQAQFGLMGQYFKTSSEWSHFLRKAGFDGIVDPGRSMVHPNEPRQSLFFSKSFIAYDGMHINKTKISHTHTDVKLSIHPTLKRTLGDFLGGKLTVELFNNPEKLAKEIHDSLLVDWSNTDPDAPLREPEYLFKRLVMDLNNLFSDLNNLTGNRRIAHVKTIIHICRVLDREIPLNLRKLYPNDAEVEKVNHLLSLFSTICEKLQALLHTELTNTIQFKKFQTDINIIMVFHSIHDSIVKNVDENGEVLGMHELIKKMDSAVDGVFTDGNILSEIKRILSNSMNSLADDVHSARIEDSHVMQFPEWYDHIVGKCNFVLSSSIRLQAREILKKYK